MGTPQQGGKSPAGLRSSHHVSKGVTARALEARASWVVSWPRVSELGAEGAPEQREAQTSAGWLLTALKTGAAQIHK